MKKIIKYLLIICMSVVAASPVFAQGTVTESVTIDDIGIAQIQKDSVNGNTSYSYVFAGELGTDTTSVSGSLHTYTYRQAIVLDQQALQPLLDLEYDLTITEVEVFYSVDGFWNDDYSFSVKRTGIDLRFFTEDPEPEIPEDDWTIIENGTDIEESDVDYGTGSFTTENFFIDELQDIYDGTSFEPIFLGALSDDEVEEDSYAAFYDDEDEFYLVVTYERPAESISATAQNDYHNSDGGNIGVGVGSNPTAYSSPKPFTGYEEQTLKLAAYDNQTIGGDLTVFNDTEAQANESEWERSKGGSTQIFAEGNQTPSLTLSEDDDGATFAAILRGKYSITRNDYSPEEGSNINSANVTVIEGNTLTAPATQNDNGIDYTFYEWSDGETENPRTIDSPTYSLTARYKGFQISNNGSAFKANQRKVVRTDNGWEHQVYESMGHIWYEAKSSSGGWEFVPRDNTPGSPLNLDTGSGKAPSIDRSFDDGLNGGDEFTVVAWQEGAQIKIHRYYRPSGPGNAYQKYGSTLTISPGQGSSYELQPTVAWSSGRYFGIFYRSSSGIKYKFYKVDATAGESGTVPGTSGAEDFAVDTYHDGSSDIFAVAFEKAASSPAGAKQIRLNYISYDHPNDIAGTVYSSSFLLSSGSYPYNRTPSVAVTDDEISVGWVSSTSSSWSPTSTKATVAHITFPSGSFHVSRSVFNSYVRSVSLSKLDDNSEYYAAWNSLYSTSPYYPPYAFHSNYVAKGSALSTVKTLNTNGWDLQLFDAPSENDMQVVAFAPTHASTAFTTPYYWEQSNALGSYLKAKPLTTTRGRGVSLSDSAGAVTFAIHNLKVDGQRVRFVPMESSEATVKEHLGKPRSLNIRQSLEQVQSLLFSQPFSVNKSSEISFEEWIGFSDSLEVLKRLGKNGRITVKAELVEAGTGKPVATLRERTLSRKDGIAGIHQAWKAEGKNLKEAAVQLVLTVSTNLNDLQAVAEDYFEDYEMLTKINPDQQTAYKELQAEPAEEIIEYGLAQNYPNPFNPSTVISYQLPENSMVRLEVFDLLGRNVATLVNERQSTGRYSVNFDASHLASGVYIYQLSAGGFVTSKKMFLIK